MIQNLKKDTYCIIMAGGIGSRFWPMSRNDKPKQFLDILGTGKSFIRQTFERFSRIIPVGNFLVVTGEQYKNLVQEHLPELTADQILCEPFRRNTAPCIAFASYKLLKRNPNAQIIVTPSDHLILNDQAFLEVMLSSLEFAKQNDALVTVGLKPIRPETGYGYIQVSKTESNLCRDSICKVKTFTEKPDLETAKLFMSSGEFYWNSGIFIWNVKTILKAFETHLPDIASLFEKGNTKYDTPLESEFIADAYSQCSNISIDYGIMEKASNVYVFGADFGWSDVGTWSSLYHNVEKISNNNAVNTKHYFAKKVTNTLINIKNKDKMVVIEGLDNFLVVDTEDVLMICPRTSEESIKSLTGEALKDYTQFG